MSTKTLVGTPDPDDEDNYNDLARRYKQERDEALRSVSKALYVPLTWMTKYKK